MPGKKSIFSLDDIGGIQDEAACDIDSEGSGDEKYVSDGADHEKGRLDGDQKCIEKIEPFDGPLEYSSRKTEEIGYVSLLKKQSTDNPPRQTCQQTQNVDLNLIGLSEGKSFYRNKSLDFLKPSRGDKTFESQTYSELSSGERDFVEKHNYVRNNHVEEEYNVSNMAKSRNGYQDLRKTGTDDYLTATTCSSSQFESCGKLACIHSILCRDSYNDQMDCVSKLASCAELSTSLECFEVVSYDVEYTFQCCPLDSQSDGNNCGSRKSTSPKKETKRGKAKTWWNGILVFFLLETLRSDNGRF